MRFRYTHEPSISEAITQAVGFGSVCWTDVAGAGEFQSGRAARCAEAAVTEVRHIITYELSKLLDPTGEAVDWNAAIETALVKVEGLR